jgi:hypothetical protein
VAECAVPGQALRPDGYVPSVPSVPSVASVARRAPAAHTGVVMTDVLAS